MLPTHLNTQSKRGTQIPKENKILMACRKGDMKSLNDAWIQGHPIDGEFLRDDGGFITPLGMAVEYGHVEIVEALLRAGARVDIPSTLSHGLKGPTAEEYAAQRVKNKYQSEGGYKKIYALIQGRASLHWKNRETATNENL